MSNDAEKTYKSPSQGEGAAKRQRARILDKTSKFARFSTCMQCTKYYRTFAIIELPNLHIHKLLALEPILEANIVDLSDG